MEGAILFLGRSAPGSTRREPEALVVIFILAAIELNNS
jgi:hypothetical protein